MIGLALFHAVTASVNWDDLRVVQESVQQCRGQYLVSQQISPVRKAGQPVEKSPFWFLIQPLPLEYAFLRMHVSSVSPTLSIDWPLLH